MSEDSDDIRAELDRARARIEELEDELAEMDDTSCDGDCLASEQAFDAVDTIHDLAIELCDAVKDHLGFETGNEPYAVSNILTLVARVERWKPPT